MSEEAQPRWAVGDEFTVDAPTNTLLNFAAADVKLTFPCGCEIVIAAGEQTTKLKCPHYTGRYHRGPRLCP